MKTLQIYCGIKFQCIAILILCTLLCTSSVKPQDTSNHIFTWSEDIDYFVSEILARHPNPEHNTSRDAIVNSAKRLKSRLATLTEHSIIVEMAKIAALIGEAHTYVDLPTSGQYAFHRLPLQFEWFPDGIYVVGADTRQSRLVGARLTKINNTSIEDVITKVRPIINADNLMTEKFLLPRRITYAEVLGALDIIDDLSKISMGLDFSGNKQTTVLQPLTSDEVIDWVPDQRDLNGINSWYWLDSEKEYWFRHIENEHTVYLQINSMRDRTEEPMVKFAPRLGKFLKDNKVERLVIDLRRNIGGDWVITIPLIREIIKSGLFETKGSLITLIGRASISATVVFASEINRYTENIFIGEPTGSCANQYGENRFIELPNSKLNVSYSTKFFQTAGPIAESEEKWITPEVAITMTAANYFSAKDPVLSAALDYEMKPSLGDLLSRTFADEGIEAGLRQYKAFKNDSRNRWIDTERTIRHFADSLQNAGDASTALTLHALNMESYPSRAYSHLGAAFAYQKANQVERSQELFKKTLEVLPNDKSLNRYNRRRLEEITQNALLNDE